MNELKTTAESILITLKIIIPVNSLIPSPDIPKTGETNSTIIETKESTKNNSIIFIVCPKDKNKKKNKKVSNNDFNMVINVL